MNSTSHPFRHIALALLALTLLAESVQAQTPSASPAASPAFFTGGCNDLDAYFQHLANLIHDNKGLALIHAAGFDALALSPADATSVVDSLATLIPQVRAVTPPEPAAAYHQAYIAMLTWYRDLAANRDPTAHQRLVNNDRKLYAQMGIAIQQGQSKCGATAWNDAWQAAFP